MIHLNNFAILRRINHIYYFTICIIISKGSLPSHLPMLSWIAMVCVVCHHCVSTCSSAYIPLARSINKRKRLWFSIWPSKKISCIIWLCQLDEGIVPVVISVNGCRYQHRPINIICVDTESYSRAIIHEDDLTLKAIKRDRWKTAKKYPWPER